MNQPTLFSETKKSSYQTLEKIVSWLNQNVQNQALEKISDLDYSQWTPNDIQNVWYLISQKYRDFLEESGFDVDLIPHPKTTSNTEQIVTVLPGENNTATVKIPFENQLNETIKTIPGAKWEGTQSVWILPILKETATKLRTILTGHKTIIDKNVAQKLKIAADTPDGPAIIIKNGRIEIKFAHTTERQTDIKRYTQAQWDGPQQCWYTDLLNAENIIRFAKKHGLIVDQEIFSLADQKYEPFDYDYTIDGLRGVPIGELQFVKASPGKNIGTKRETPSLEKRFKEYGIQTIYDLISTVPFRYQDRSKQTPIRELIIGEENGFIATITKISQYDRGKKLFRVTVADTTGEITVTFFNSPWLMKKFHVKDEVVVYGRVDIWQGGGRTVKQMSNPIMDLLGEDQAMIIPVYPQSEKTRITTWDLHGATMEAVRKLGDLQDPLPENLKQTHHLIDRKEAYRQVHNPDSITVAEQARTRLAFDELFRMQMVLGLKRYATAEETGITHQPTGKITEQFLKKLPFKLTNAQQKAYKEISTDLQQPHPMYRLIQGDVGSGKSAIGFLTLLEAVEGGYQAAMMAPTEILATQLFTELADELTGLTHPDGHPLIVEFLGGKTRIKDRRRILAGLEDGTVDILVGTHALITEEVNFANLGVVVIDEQHRFGVEQRAALRAKGTNGVPDMLVMTATPIPRTAALTVFGDLQLSILDELPPGRTPIATTWLQGEPELDVITGPPWDLIRAEVEKGHQAYVVASLVEDNEKIAAASAEAAMESLQNGALTGLRLGLVHGKQPRDDRDTTMKAFKNKELDVLIATTVIEVGVNVPNATVMVILDATRFGIAQLHQIRGRVGRGKNPSRCVLTGKAGSSDAVRRMQALVASTDGFYLSEVDLNLRGEGSIFGARQSGQTDLKVASLKNDRELVLICRNETENLLRSDPKLQRKPGLRNEIVASLGETDQEWLAKS